MELHILLKFLLSVIMIYHKWLKDGGSNKVIKDTFGLSIHPWGAGKIVHCGGTGDMQAIIKTFVLTAFNIVWWGKLWSLRLPHSLLTIIPKPVIQIFSDMNGNK